MYNPPVNISDNRWSKRIHDALPAFMNQKPDSTNQKVLSIYTDYGNQYKNDILFLTDQTLIQHAKGQMLDRLCDDWNVHIIDEKDDEFKRFQIKFQMLRHRLGPGTNDIKGLIALLFNIPQSDFKIVSAGLKAIKVVDLPFNFDTGDKTDLKRQLIAQYIRAMMPPEYKLSGITYQKWTNAHWYFSIWPEHTIMLDVEQQPINYNKQVTTNVENHYSLIGRIKHVHQQPINYQKSVNKTVASYPVSIKGYNKRVHQNPFNYNKQVSKSINANGTHSTVSFKNEHQKPINYDKSVDKKIASYPVSISGHNRHVHQNPFNYGKQVSKPVHKNGIHSTVSFKNTHQEPINSHKNVSKSIHDSGTHLTILSNNEHQNPINNHKNVNKSINKYSSRIFSRNIHQSPINSSKHVSHKSTDYAAKNQSKFVTFERKDK